MKLSFNKLFLIAAILYLLAGVVWQIGLCTTPTRVDEYGAVHPDIPCAGIVWTPIIVLGWPYFGLFDLGFPPSNDPTRINVLRGVLTLGAFLIIVALPIIGLVRELKKKDTRV